MSAKKTEVGCQYRHYKKGTIYRVLAVAKDCEDPSREFVCYQNVLDDGVWVRERTDFEATVNVNGDLVPRFAKVRS